jgi:hypothetical protein
MVKPAAGARIASRCTVVILGGKKPWVVLAISTFAEALGDVVPIPTSAPLLCILLLVTTQADPFQ